jgi:hypothetical protein
MKNPLLTIFNQSFSGGTLIVVLSISSMPFCLFSQDSNTAVYNQLYEEIITAAGNGNADKPDSIRSRTTGGHEQKSGISSQNTTDIVNERLKTEMEKIIKDAQIRHSDAVKFIQETK